MSILFQYQLLFDLGRLNRLIDKMIFTNKSQELLADYNDFHFWKKYHICVANYRDKIKSIRIKEKNLKFHVDFYLYVVLLQFYNNTGSTPSLHTYPLQFCFIANLEKCLISTNIYHALLHRFVHHWTGEGGGGLSPLTSFLHLGIQNGDRNFSGEV